MKNNLDDLTNAKQFLSKRLNNYGFLVFGLRDICCCYEDHPILLKMSEEYPRMRELLALDIRAMCLGEEFTEIFLKKANDKIHTSVVFFKKNNFETSESLMWLIMHEYVHAFISEHVANIRYLEMVAENSLAIKNGVEVYSGEWNKLNEDDEFHDNLPEEAFANSIATAIIGKDYGRKWWREQRNGSIL